jgi:FtsH-binding integral membrane protein
MNKLLLQIFVGILIFVCVIFGIANSAITDGQFVCNRYILNTYLYIILTLNLLALQVLIMEYKNVLFQPNLLLFFGIFILILISIVAMHKISPKQIVIKHIVWLMFIILMGLLFYPMYSLYTHRKGYIAATMLTTILLFIGLSAVAYIRPDLISLSWGPVLLASLIGVIVLEVLMLIFNKGYTTSSKWFRLISYFVVGIFMIFILYDTKRLQINATKCVVADYISESLKLFLDIWNIFVRLLSLGR